MRTFLKLILAILFALPAWAQYTTVTATNLTDYCSFPLANVPYNASLIVPADATTQPTFTGTTAIVPQPVIVGQLTDATGSLSFVLADNSQISTGSATSTQWRFNIGTTQATAIGASGSPWITLVLTISGASQSITATVQAAMPVYPCPAVGDNHNLLSTTHPDTTPYTPPEIGDLIRGSLTQKWERFAKGTASQILAMNSGATLPAWQNFKFYQNSLTPVNSVGRLGINLVAGTNVTITSADDGANDRVNYTISATGGSTALPQKFYVLLPQCSNDSFIGIENLTPIESYFTRVFNNMTVADIGSSNCYVTYGTTASIDGFAEIKEASELVRDKGKWSVRFYLRLIQATNIRMWFGATNSLATGWQTDDIPGVYFKDGAMFRFSSGTGGGIDPGAGDTFWQAVSAVNSGAPIITPTAVAPDTDWHLYESSYNGSNTLTWKIDGITVNTQAATFTDGLPILWYSSITNLNTDTITPVYYDFASVLLTESEVMTGP